GKLTYARKDTCPAMRLHHCLQEKLDKLWMKVASHQHLYCAANEHHVIGRSDAVEIDHTLRQHEPNEVRENTGESVRHGEAHESNLGIAQQGADSRCIRKSGDPPDIHFALIEGRDCRCSSERKQRGRRRIDAAPAKDSLRRKSSAASYGADGDALALEL